MSVVLSGPRRVVCMLQSNRTGAIRQDDKEPFAEGLGILLRFVKGGVQSRAAKRIPAADNLEHSDLGLPVRRV